MARSTNRGERAREAELQEVVARTCGRKRAIARDAPVEAEIDAIRREVVSLAEAHGWLSDEDVFRGIS